MPVEKTPPEKISEETRLISPITPEKKVSFPETVFASFVRATLSYPETREAERTRFLFERVASLDIALPRPVGGFTNLHGVIVTQLINLRPGSRGAAFRFQARRCSKSRTIARGVDFHGRYV